MTSALLCRSRGPPPVTLCILASETSFFCQRRRRVKLGLCASSWIFHQILWTDSCALVKLWFGLPSWDCLMAPIHSNSTCINYVLFHRKALILAASGMETAKTNMMEQLPSEILVKIWLLKHGQTGGGSGQTGGGVSGGSPEKMCEENFYRNGLNLVSMHRRFQLYPILHAQNFFWLWKWPSKLKSHFFRGSFSQPTSNIKWVGEPD